MTFNLILVACFLASLQPIYSNPASFINKCAITDSKCIKASAQVAIPIVAAGIPELGVDVLDPIEMKTIDGSSQHLKLKLKDVKATGLSQCIAKKIQFNEDQSKLLVKLLCTVDARGQYLMDGKISALPIKGEGNAHVLLNKILITANLDMNEEKDAEGKIHWKISKWQHSYELKEKSVVELDNLFSGNEVLGRAVKQLLSTNSNEVVQEVGPPIVKAVVTKIVKNVNKFFAKVPTSDLVL